MSFEILPVADLIQGLIKIQQNHENVENFLLRCKMAAFNACTKGTLSFI